MKPAKKAKAPMISKARIATTRRMLSLWDQAERSERNLYDAEAIAEATRRFLEQAQDALVAAAGVSAKERAEAVFDAARQFWEQSRDAVAAAQVALEKARDALFSYNDERVAEAEADLGLREKVLSRRGERPHAVQVDIDDLSDEASAGKKK